MIDSINPTAKTVGMLIGSIALGFTFHWQLNVLLSLVCLLFLVTSKRAKLSTMMKVLVPIAFISVSYFMTGWLFSSEQALFSLTTETIVAGGRAELINGLNLGSRILAFGMIGISYSLTTDSYDLIVSFIQQARMPMRVGYAILTAFNLTSLIQTEYEHSKLALQVRNLPVKGFDTKPLFTMMVRVVRWSERLSLSMEAKGFSEKRTMHKQLRLTTRDIAFAAGFPLLIIGLGIVWTR